MRVTLEKSIPAKLYRVPYGDILRTLDRLMTEVDAMVDKLRDAGVDKGAVVTINFDNHGNANIFVDGNA
jgi:hypothetical protein